MCVAAVTVRLIAARRFAMVLLLIAICGFAGRVIYVLVVTRHEPIASLDHYFGDRAVRSFDEIYYVNGADALVHGDWFRFSELPGNPVGARAEQALHPPLTSIAFAPVAALTTSETALRHWVAFAGAALLVIVGLLGRELGGERAGLLAAGLAAVYPGIWLNDGVLLSETYAMLFTTGAVLATYRCIRRPRLGMAIVVGLACACAMLTRAELAPLAPLLAFAILLRTSSCSRGRRLVLAGATALVAVVAVTPWIAYNFTRFEKPVTLSYGAGGLISGANNDSTYRGQYVGYWVGLGARAFSTHGDGSEIADAALQTGIDYAGNHLDRVPAVVAFRVGRIWGVYRPVQMAEFEQAEGRPQWASLTAKAMSPLLLLLGIWGVVVLVRRRTAILPILAPILLVILGGALFYGSTRLRAFSEPSLVVLAAVGFDQLLARGRSSSVGAEGLDPPLREPRHRGTLKPQTAEGPQ